VSQRATQQPDQDPGPAVTLMRANLVGENNITATPASGVLRTVSQQPDQGLGPAATPSAYPRQTLSPEQLFGSNGQNAASAQNERNSYGAGSGQYWNEYEIPQSVLNAERDFLLAQERNDAGTGKKRAAFGSALGFGGAGATLVGGGKLALSQANTLAPVASTAAKFATWPVGVAAAGYGFERGLSDLSNWTEEQLSETLASIYQNAETDHAFLNDMKAEFQRHDEEKRQKYGPSTDPEYDLWYDGWRWRQLLAGRSIYYEGAQTYEEAMDMINETVRNGIVRYENELKMRQPAFGENPMVEWQQEMLQNEAR